MNPDRPLDWNAVVIGKGAAVPPKAIARGAANTVLTQTVVNDEPAFAKVDLASMVTGVLPPANGGSGGSGGGSTLPSCVQGDLFYATAVDTVTTLVKSTSATRYLTNTGSSNNPAWGQVNLANGVTGSLPAANGGTGLNTSASTGVAQVTAGTWSVSAIDLATADVTGLLPAANGGTGTNSSASTGIPHVAAGTWTYAGVNLASTDVTGLLPAANGGTGTNSSASTGLAHVTTGAWTYSAVNLASTDVTGLLPATKGGTGLDSSASTGVAQVTAGTWSVSAIDLATADVTGLLPPANGGTGLNTSASTGVAQVTAGVWSVSAIDLATGDVTGVLPVANGGTGSSDGVNLTSAIWNISLWDDAIWPVVFGVLPPAQGGTGLDTSASTGVAQVTAGLWSVSAIDLATADVTGDLPYANLTPASSGSTLLGRGASGAGDWQEIALGTNLSMSGTTLNAAGAAGGAPTTATYITQTADATLSAEQALSSLASGYMKVTTGTGVVTSQATPIPIADGGTAQSTAAAARSASGLNTESATGVGNTNYTILATDRLVYTTATLSTARTWTLPAASAVNPGHTVWIVDAFAGITSTNTLTISRAGSDTVEGITGITLSNSRATLCLASDGVSQWLQAVGDVKSAGGGITSGEIAYWLITGGGPRLGHTARVPTTAGGTNLDTSASTGIAKVAAGTWGVSAVDLATANVTGVLPFANGGTNSAVGPLSVLGPFYGTAVPAGSTVFLGRDDDATELNVQLRLPCNGFVVRMDSQASLGAGGTETYTYTFRTGAGDSALTHTNTARTGSSTGSIVVTAGGVASIKLVTSAAAVATNHMVTLAIRAVD